MNQIDVQSLTVRPVTDPVRLLTELRTSTDKRRDTQRRRLDILQDNAVDHIGRRIRERFADAANRSNLLTFLDLSCNPYASLNAKLSTVYKEPARRQFAKAQQTKLWQQIAPPDMDLTMDGVNQITMALNECFVRAVVRDARINLDVITPDTAVVNAAGTSLRAIAYATDEGYSYVDPLIEMRFDEHMRALGGPVLHGAGMCPVVVFRRKWPMRGFFLGQSGESLVELYFDQVIGRSWLNMLGYFQSHKEMARKPTPEQFGSHGVVTQQAAGPHVIHDGDLSVLDMRADLQQFLNVLEGKLQRAANDLGVSTDVLNQSTLPSGMAAIMAHSGLNGVRMGTIKLFRPAEELLMMTAAAVWNGSGAGQLFSEPRDLGPSIDYAEPRLIESRKDQIEILSVASELGVTSPVDDVMASNPDLKDRAAAMEIIRQNLAEVGEVLEARRKFNQPEQVAAALGAVGGMASGAARQPLTESEVDPQTQSKEQQQ